MGKGEESWERVFGAGCCGEGFAKMASYNDRGAQGPSNLRDFYILAVHYCCVLMLLALLLWQPRYTPVGRVVDFASLRTFC